MQYKSYGQDRISTSAGNQGPTVMSNASATGLSDTTMWYANADINSTTAAMELGATWCDAETGNWFKYVKATAGLTPGQFVSFAAPTAGTTTAAGSTVYNQVTNITTTAVETGNYLWILDAAGTYSAGVTPFSQSLRRIKGQIAGGVEGAVGANTTFILSRTGSIYGNNQYDPDFLPKTATNGAACYIVRPNNVIVATNATPPIGVALGEVTSGRYTIIQVAGLAMVQYNNTIAAAVIGKAGVMQAAGITSGPTAGTMTAANLDTIVGTSIYPQALLASATTSLIPAYINFLGT